MYIYISVSLTLPVCGFVFGVFFDFNNAMNKINDLKERNLAPFCNVSSISLDQYKVVKTIPGSERAQCLYAHTCTLHIFTLFADSILLLKQWKSAKIAKIAKCLQKVVFLMI